MNFNEGEIICIDKPYRMSSFGALAHIRFLISNKLGVKRVKTGHAGTLDPLATGVLILCTGKATKRIDELQAHTKEYTATLQLGATTPSFDKEHTVDHTYPTAHITEELIRETLQKFIGEIQQVPPAYSACKINGHRAYKLMRKGHDVPLKAKTLRVDIIRPEDDAALDKSGVRKRNLHTCFGKRYRHGSWQWCLSYRPAQNTGGGHKSGKLHNA